MGYWTYGDFWGKLPDGTMMRFVSEREYLEYLEEDDN